MNQLHAVSKQNETNVSQQQKTEHELNLSNKYHDKKNMWTIIYVNEERCFYKYSQFSNHTLV